MHVLNYHDGMENTNKACRLVNFVLVGSVATVRTHTSVYIRLLGNLWNGMAMELVSAVLMGSGDV